MTQFISTVQSRPFGSVPQIPNEFATAELATTILTDPVQIRAFKQSVADQMNAQSTGPRFEDLTERIQTVKLETSAQGASILTVPLIDPLWVLPMSGFIQTDELGFLWPPIDVNFPTGTDCVWRLAQADMSWDADFDPTQGNIILTFEDRIASLLRQMSAATPGGLSQGQPNQTLGGFFKQLVDNTNSVLHLKKGEVIRLVEMISPQDPNYTPPINNLPASAQSPLRPDPLKQKTGLTAQQQKQLDSLQNAVAQFFADHPAMNIGEAEPYAKQLINTSAAISGNADYVPNSSYIPGVDTNP